MRFIICGSSPSIKKLSRNILYTGRVIAVNQAPEEMFIADNADFWVCWDDTAKSIKEFELSLFHLINRQTIRVIPKTENWMREMERWNQRGILWYERGTVTSHQADPIMEWGRPPQLVCAGSVVTTAMNFAYLMGATVIVLCGVDFLGTTRFNGQHCSDDKGMAHMAKETSIFARTLIERAGHRGQRIRIYKTVEESPLELPYLNPEKYS